MEATRKHTILRCKGGVCEQREDLVAVERRLRVKINGKDVLALYCTPLMVRELVVGLIMTEGIAEGFPDITTTPAERGYSGNLTPRNGYVLYGHDKVTADATGYETVNYYKSPATEYFYTCEANGTVRQWSDAEVAAATEYVDNVESVSETRAVISVNMYSKVFSK